MGIDDRLKLIETHYNAALLFLNDKNFYLATNEIYKLMDAKDYDLSLDIMYNQNDYCKNESLRQLIQKVDKALVDYSEIEEISDIEDFSDIF